MKWSLLALFFGGHVWAADFGTFIIVKGNVFVEDAKAVRREAKFNSQIFSGETVITEKDSRAKIVMSDRNVINVLPSTRLKIEKYSSAEGDRNVRLNLIEGRIRNRVGPYDSKSSKFEIKTGTSVAGVRGTEFIVGYDAKKNVTEVLSISGSVGVRSAAAASDLSREILVKSQERLFHSGDSENAKPKRVPQKELDQIKKETAVSTEKEGTAAGSGSGAGTVNVGANEDVSGANGQNTVGSSVKPPTNIVPGVLPPTKTNVNLQITIPGQ